MNERGEDRGEHPQKGERDPGGVHTNRAPEVEHDDAIAAFTDREHFDQAREVARHQRDVAGFQRHVSALAHRNKRSCASRPRVPVSIGVE